MYLVHIDAHGPNCMSQRDLQTLVLTGVIGGIRFLHHKSSTRFQSNGLADPWLSGTYSPPIHSYEQPLLSMKEVVAWSVRICIRILCKNLVN